MSTDHESRRLAAWLAVLVVFGATACCLRHPPAPPGPGAYLDLTPLNVPRIERLRHALMSVHAYVEQRNPRLRAMFANVKPWRLDEAAKEIAADPERFAPRRRRRIAVRLLAHARQEPDAVAAVEVLLGRAAEKILAQLARAGHSDQPDLLEPSVSAVVASVLGPTPVGTCTDWKGSGLVAWRAAGTTSPSRSTPMRANDRQRQEGARPAELEQISKLWLKTYLVAPEYQLGLAPGDPPADASPPALGSEWRGRTLFEEFVCDKTQWPYPCDLKLLLRTTTVAPSTGASYLASFDMPQPLGTTPQIVVDHGSIKATKNTSQTLTAHSEKVVGFADMKDSAALYAVLKNIDVSYYLSELACCF